MAVIGSLPLFGGGRTCSTVFVFNTVITIMIMTPGELKHVKFY